MAGYGTVSGDIFYGLNSSLESLETDDGDVRLTLDDGVNYVEIDIPPGVLLELLVNTSPRFVTALTSLVRRAVKNYFT